MCDQHNVRASAEDNTDKGHTPNPRTEIKIPDPAGNRTRAAGLEAGTLPTTAWRRIKILHISSIKIIKFWHLLMATSKSTEFQCPLSEI